jgi:Fur family ferric uptake transcriptional regulator
MQAPVETFETRLRERGIRMTSGRRAVVRAIVRHRGHFDAEGLLARIRRDGDPASRATVYRTITCLVDAGLLRKYDLGDRRTLFEPAVGKDHHEHMICVVCGDILEFVEERIERLQDEVCRAHRFRPFSHTLHIHGVCERCDRLDESRSEDAAARDEALPQVWRRRALRG